THRRAVPGLLLALLASHLAVPPAARAADPDDLIDVVEHLLGATNVQAITGHGRMAAGISADGDLTVLSWPTPSFADQLAYISSNAVDARSRPLLGAQEGAGLFLGLLLELADTSRQVVWLRDRTIFTVTQSYGPEDGGNVETRFVSPELGLTVTLTDAIL